MLFSKLALTLFSFTLPTKHKSYPKIVGSLNKNILLVSLFGLFITACGGGSSTESNAPDTIKPVITLNGDANITLTVGDTYADAGATATDDSDGNVTVDTTGSVDTTTSGKYTIIYTATDVAGNSATETRTVTVTQAPDTTKPVITLNGDAKIILTVGDTYADAGATASDDSDGNITTNIQTVSKVNTSAPGIYTVTYNVSDAAGNSADEVSRTVEINVQKRELSLLIIRVSFSDFQIVNSASIWHDKLFGTSSGQLNGYYDEISYGKFGFKEARESFGDVDDGIIDVTLPYSHPHPESDISKKTPIAIDAYNLIDEFINISSFDKNNDKQISRDELLIMFVIAGQETTHPVTNFLPEGSRGVGAHKICFKIRGHTRNNITLFECKPESTQEGNFVIVGERHARHDATIGQIAHELGHAAFGIPDLYDTDQTSNGIGTFGLMAHGAWGKKNSESFIGETPTHMTGWSKIQAGFIEAEKITNSVDNLRVVGTTSSEYKPYRIDTKKEGEYFIIENREANSYDKGFDNLDGLDDNEGFKGGLLILHIDDNITTNKNENHKKVDVVEASNSGLDDKLNRGHINNLFFEGNINEVRLESYDGTPIANITNISIPGTIMTIDIDRL